MISLSTGRNTKLGEKIRVGDIVQGSQTHPMLVCINTIHKHMGPYTCVMTEKSVKDGLMGSTSTYTIQEGFVFGLDEIISAWGDLKVIDNIIVK